MFLFAILLVFAGCGSSVVNYDSLNVAVAKGDVKTVEKFLNNGGDVDTKLMVAFSSSGSHAVLDDGSGPGMTLLMKAAFYSDNSYEVAKLLLERGADVHARDKEGETVITAAKMGNGSESNKEAMINLLKRYGAE
jgi:hypothetical protein